MTPFTDLSGLSYEQLATERRVALDDVAVLARLAAAGRPVPVRWQAAANGVAAAHAAACLVEMRSRRPVDPQTARNVALSVAASRSGEAAAEAQKDGEVAS